MKTPCFASAPVRSYFFRFCPGLILLFTAGFFGGCCHLKVTPPPDNLFLTPTPAPAVGKSDPPSPAEADALRKIPVVDIHTHTFNALYLPLVNIARGRVYDSDIGPPFVDIATVLAQTLVGF